MSIVKALANRFSAKAETTTTKREVPLGKAKPTHMTPKQGKAINSLCFKMFGLRIRQWEASPLIEVGLASKIIKALKTDNQDQWEKALQQLEIHKVPMQLINAEIQEKQPEAEFSNPFVEQPKAEVPERKVAWVTLENGKTVSRTSYYMNYCRVCKKYGNKKYDIDTFYGMIKRQEIKIGEEVFGIAVREFMAFKDELKTQPKAEVKAKPKAKAEVKTEAKPKPNKNEDIKEAIISALDAQSKANDLMKNLIKEIV